MTWAYLGAGAVVGVHVDPPHDVAGVEDRHGRHRHAGGAVRLGVDGRQVEAENSSCAARASSDGWVRMPRVRAMPLPGSDSTGEAQVRLFLHGQRIRSGAPAGVDRCQPDAAFGQRRAAGAAVGRRTGPRCSTGTRLRGRTPATAVAVARRLVQAGRRPVRVKQFSICELRAGPGNPGRRRARGGQQRPAPARNAPITSLFGGSLAIAACISATRSVITGLRRSSGIPLAVVVRLLRRPPFCCPPISVRACRVLTMPRENLSNCPHE